MLVAGFPYQIVCHISADDIRSFAFAHLKRRPGFWRQRRWQLVRRTRCHAAGHHPHFFLGILATQAASCPLSRFLKRSSRKRNRAALSFPFTSLRREHSSPYAFDNREVSFGGNDAPELEPGSLQQLPEFRLGALPATWREH